MMTYKKSLDTDNQLQEMEERGCSEAPVVRAMQTSTLLVEIRLTIMFMAYLTLGGGVVTRQCISGVKTSDHLHY